MTADLFLTCFLACLFAFVVFGVLAYQIGGYLVKRAVEKNLPEILSKMLHGAGDPEAREALAELARSAPPSLAVPYPAMKCQCGREQSVPDVPVVPFLEEIGWRWVDADVVGGALWKCPLCAASFDRPSRGTKA
jgi:hypothetical protein